MKKTVQLPVNNASESFGKRILSILQRRQDISALRFFLIVASITGLVFIVITPPFQTPDERVHFFRTFQISEFNFITDVNETGAIGGYIPVSIVYTMGQTADNPTIQFAPEKKYDSNRTLRAFRYSLNAAERKFYDFSATAQYSPVSYLPQAAGVGLARLLRLPPIAMMYAGRVMNLAMWIALIGLSIQLMPRRKWATAFIGLLPMALFQASSLSTDVMTVGLFAVYLALLLRLLQQKTPITNSQLTALVGLGAAMTLSKQVMVVFLLGAILIPPRLFATKRRSAIMKFALVALPFVVYALWIFATRELDITRTFSNGQNPLHQVKFVLHNPHSFINVLWNTHFFFWGDAVTRSFIGNFGWVDAPLSEMIVVLGYIGLFLVIVVNTGERPAWLSKWQRWVLGFSGLAYWGAVSAALYAFYSPVGYKIIVGMQGRYFLPLALIAIPILYSSWLKTSPRAYRNLATLVPIFLLVASIITIYFRYYINNV